MLGKLIALSRPVGLWRALRDPKALFAELQSCRCHSARSRHLPLSWQLLTMFEDPKRERCRRVLQLRVLIHLSPTSTSQQQTCISNSLFFDAFPLTGVDELTTLVLYFEKARSQGIVNSNMEHFWSLSVHPHSSDTPLLSPSAIVSYSAHAKLVQGEKDQRKVCSVLADPRTHTTHASFGVPLCSYISRATAGNQRWLVELIVNDH